MHAHPQGHMLRPLSTGVLRPYCAPGWNTSQQAGLIFAFRKLVSQRWSQMGKETTPGCGGTTVGLCPVPGTSSVASRSSQKAGSPRGLRAWGLPQDGRVQIPRPRLSPRDPAAQSRKGHRAPWPTWASAELEPRRCHQHSPAPGQSPGVGAPRPTSSRAWGVCLGCRSLGRLKGTQGSMVPPRGGAAGQASQEVPGSPQTGYFGRIPGTSSGFLAGATASRADHKRRKPSWAEASPGSCFSSFLPVPGCGGPGRRGQAHIPAGSSLTPGCEDGGTVYTASTKGLPADRPTWGHLALGTVSVNEPSAWSPKGRGWLTPSGPVLPRHRAPSLSR